MEKIRKLINTASNISAVFSSIFMILIVVLISIEIFLRAIFNKSTLIADEYSAYMFVFLVMLGLSYTFKEKGHIKITILTSRLKGKFAKIIDIFALGLAIGIVLFSLYYSTLMVYDTYSLDMRADTIAETSLYIPEIALPLGYAIFALQLILSLFDKLLNNEKDNL